MTPPAPELQRPAWWVPRVLAAVVATVVVVAGPGWLAGLGGGTAATRTVADDDAGRQEAPRDVIVTTYAVGAGAAGVRLRADRQLVEDTTDSLLEVAVEQLVRGRVVDDDLRTAWPTRATRTAVRVGTDRVSVDLAGLDGTAVPPARGRLALQALVWTVDTATRSHLPVEVLLDGAPVDRLWGVDLAAPLRADEDVLAGVQVDRPADATVVSSAFTVCGWTRAEDGRVAWQVRDGDEVVRSGTTSAGPGRSGVARYAFDVSSPVGDYLLVVTSAGDRDTKQLRVR